MNKPTRRTGVAAAVLATVGVTTVLATGASAFTERDEVLIDRTGYDVAGDGFTDGVPDAPAILEYLNAIVDERDIRRHIRLGHKVISTDFDSGTARWQVVVGWASTVVIVALNLKLLWGFVAE